MQLEKELQEIGFQEKEARVYIALLELGKSGVQDISKKSGVNRATTYFILESLMKKGLVSADNQEKKQAFIPEDPSQITRLIDQQKAELDRKKERIGSIVRQLETINATKIHEPIVKYYLGKEGIMKMAKSSFVSAKGGEMWVAFSKDVLEQYFSQEEIDSLREKRKGEKIRIHTIYNTHTTSLSASENDNDKEVSAEKYPILSDIAIYGDKVRITSFQDNIGIVIQNKSIASTLVSLFKLAFASKE